MPTHRPLTVLQILPALHAGGVERGTLEIARHLVQNGHRSLVMSGGGRMVAQLESEGSTHFNWNIGKKSLLTLRLVPQLRQFLIEHQIDILHLRSRMPGWIGYLAWRKMDPATRPKLVTTVHGAYTVNAYSAVMTKGERVIAVSKTIHDYILTYYPQVAPSRIRLIYRGVDPLEFPRGYQPDSAWLTKWRNDYPHLAGKLIITLPGRITRWKGQLDFIQLISRLKHAGINVHGLLAGEADPRKTAFLQELKTQISALDLDQDISLIGHRTDLKEVMAVSDLVLSLSQDPEAFGRITPEALSLGIPVVGYNHGGVGEVLQALFPAGLVPLGDLQKFENTVRHCLSHPSIIAENKTFTLAHMQSSTLAVYQELVTS
ncbi:glycosyl transferase [Sulfuriferula sp. AH1]|uniref:glycosyltransferase family 4 protein n=1 Tax=Sulfuriferula sp. AH1 TaxID=1985873 RepID=UPI000B3B935D|nr:glycosyltransferase family 4 protein [Sulfuriferula sp. AH1]ARU31518.1 glycosyl transferase [Sulfuriferula sp. AH1]